MRISDWSSDVCSSDLLAKLVVDAHFLLALDDKIAIGQDMGDDRRHDRVETLLAMRLAVAGGIRSRLGVNQLRWTDRFGQHRFKTEQLGQSGAFAAGRSEERSVGKECVSKGRSR